MISNIVLTPNFFRDGGVIQIFNSPHPSKNTGNSYWDPKKAPNLMAYLNISEDIESELSLENTLTGLEFHVHLSILVSNI